eukprot:TRINITY_DN17502_c0_g1_i1.p1 TRINITY_DN17502_c0_g1~~TRINITY_DN17502_c0_g1_i1.p1  ORF type:complete len:626 (+),score=201.43 TRINITY_DN17502_c0_g1_i1:32-1879(+)
MSSRTALGTLNAGDVSTRSRRSLSAKDARQSIGRRSMGMSDRKSLSSAGGRRSSIGRQSMGGPSFGRASIGSRASLGGRRMSGRRSSIHGSATGTSDPRPLSEKQWKIEATRKLIEFLSNRGYPGALSKKLLEAPSIKVFSKIFTFIYETLNPNYEPGATKPEDEIPAIFKSLNYPYPIKKSAIFACGSSHNWPKLLGALIWLVDVIDFIEGVDAPHCWLATSAQLIEGKEPDSSRAETLISIEDAYNANMVGDLSAEDDMYARAQDKLEQLQMDAAQAQERNAALKHELAQLEASAPPVDELRARKATFEGDKHKFMQLIANLEAHQAKQEQKLQQALEEKEQREAEQQRLAAELENLKHTLENQEMSPADVDRINGLNRQLDRDLQHLNQRKDKVEQEAWKLEMGVSKQLQSLEAKSLECNNILDQLDLSNVRVEVKGAEDCPSASLDRLVDKAIKPAIMGLVERASNNTSAAGSAKLEALNELSKIDEAIQAKQDELSVMQSRLEAMEAECKETQDNTSKEYKQQANTVAAMQSEVTRMKMDAAARVSSSYAQLEQYRIRYDEFRQNMEHDIKAFQEAVKDLVFNVNSCKDFVRDSTTRVVQEVEQMMPTDA